MRLVAVLGYSGRQPKGLHELCAARLRHAEQVSEGADAVLLSGGGPRVGGASEAELMRSAWSGGDVWLIADTTAGNTMENAVNIAETARRLHATEVTVVTSAWHAFRARAFVRAALPGVVVRTSSPGGRRPLALLVREVGCLVALPYHLTRLRAQRNG